MGDKGKEPAQESVEKNSSADVSALDCISEIPKINPEDLEGHDNPTLAMFNTLTGHLNKRDSHTRYMLKSNCKQLTMLTEHVVGHRKLVNLIWKQHSKLEKAFKEEKELTRKGIQYSIERSGGYAIPDSQPTIHEELLRAFGPKSKDKGVSTSAATSVANVKLQQAASQLKRKLDFDSCETEQGATASEAALPEIEEVPQLKFGYIGSIHFPQAPPGMQFLLTEIACGAYVFSRSKDKTEVLYEDDRQSLDRKTLWQLRLNKIVPSQILDAVATMLTDETSRSIWWLPTYFQELALNPAGYCKETLEFMIRRYMGYVDETVKIYVPLSCSGHWFLLVVDLRDSKRIYLDSLKDVTAKDERMRIVNFVGYFMQTLFKERRFYKKAHSIPPNIATDFEPEEPYVAQQDYESKDSIVWVAYWMQMANLWSSYDPEVVNEQHRYRLAISLLMTKANRKRDDIGQAALRYYEGMDGSREIELDIRSDSSSSSNQDEPEDLGSDSMEI